MNDLIVIAVVVVAGVVAYHYYQRRRASRQGVRYLRHYRKYSSQPKGRERQ